MRNWSIKTRLLAGFGVLTCMLLTLGIDAIQGMNTLANQTRNLYEHPMAVTNAILTVDSNIARMHRAMKDVALAHNAEEISAAEAAVDGYEQTVLAQMKVVQTAFLGAPEMVQTIHRAIADWKPVRTQSIALMRAEQREEAIVLIKTKGVEKVAAINKAVADLNTWAQNKGATFYDNAKTTQTQTVWWFTVTMIAAAIAAVVIAIYLASSITKPLARALQLAKTVATGDLTYRTEDISRDEIGQLLSTMQAMQQSLGQVAGSVRLGAESVATASAQIAQGNNDLSQRTEEQASALEQTATTMNQLSGNVTHNAERARAANSLAADASAVAVKGGHVVTRVVETMKGINDSSKRIADIISVIDGIAFQTNILALNAAVEAARAGEQGRGFAVVASEVRSLAGRSADAAKEIKSLIHASVERVEQGSLLVNQAGLTMSEVVGSIKRVTDIMGDISSASDEQNTDMGRIGEAIKQMDQATQQNAALVEEMAAAATSLKSQAQELVQAVDVFKLERAA